MISAHWFSRSELQINVEPNPALMYDFYGFPEPLYQIRWPATSPQWLQEAVSDQLPLAGLPATPVRRELDHGVWSPLSLMDPDSELPWCRSPSRPVSPRPSCGNWGRHCRGCASKGSASSLSGAITHNLRALEWDGSPVPQWGEPVCPLAGADHGSGRQGALKSTGPGAGRGGISSP